jgi:plasmid stabilization system protein ParE
VSFEVTFAASAEADLLRLFDYLLEKVETAEDLLRAQGVLDTLRVAITSHLVMSPWSYRKAGDGRTSTRRELIVPAGAVGYVALYEIEGPSSVVVLALRHQLEDDYH